MTNEPSEDIDFFISYTGTDVRWARWVARTLEDAGYRVIYQERDFRSGNFMEDIEKAIRRSSRVLPILSEAYLQSRYCTLEWTTFMRDPTSVIPVKVQDFAVRTLLANQARVNLIGLSANAATEKLREEVARLVGTRVAGAIGGPAQAFPGATRIAPEVPRPQEATASPARITAGRIELLVLGTLEDTQVTIGDLTGLFGVDRVHDLHASQETVADQQRQVENILKSLDDDVTDVVVVLAGHGSPPSDVGVSLHIRSTRPDDTATSFRLRNLLELLEQQLEQRRVHVLLDIREPGGKAISTATPAKVPVLDMRTTPGSAVDAGGIEGLVHELDKPADVLVGRLEHWFPLGLTDFAKLSGGKLVLPPGWGDAEVGLAPNPLAWPAAAGPPAEANGWCFVTSATEEDRGLLTYALQQLEFNRRDELLAELRAVDPDATLEEQAARCHASTALLSPAAFARAVQQVCRADLAVFDVTNYEPAVMVLLGIRAVIRRGVTVCVYGQHDNPWRRENAPFHLREVSLLECPGYRMIGDRLTAGLRQLRDPSRTYCDLPAFEPIRAVPSEVSRRVPRPLDDGEPPTMLALVPFDEHYSVSNWLPISENLPDAVKKLRKTVDAIKVSQDPIVLRSLDLDSPRVVSAQLYEAMRLNDFCLVDVSGARPNIMFELGVRLAANALFPIVVHDPDSGVAALGEHAAKQLEQLIRMLDVIRYGTSGGDLPTFRTMVARHVELRLLLKRADHPRAATVLNGFPPSGVFDLAWRFAQARDERFALPVAEQLQAAADALLPDSTAGERPFAYPEHLAEAADANGRERLIAAWLYRHFRQEAGQAEDPDVVGTYEELTNRLMDELEEADDPADADFAKRMRAWRADEVKE